jgi:hypothetical protein
MSPISGKKFLYDQYFAHFFCTNSCDVSMSSQLVCIQVFCKNISKITKIGPDEKPTSGDRFSRTMANDPANCFELLDSDDLYKKLSIGFAIISSVVIIIAFYIILW